MKLVSAAEMRNIDNEAINNYRIPGVVLMENAGKSVALKCAELTADSKQKKIIIFAGRGNNGGDGFVAARHLLNKGFSVKVFLLGNPADLQGDTQVNYKILESMNCKVHAVFEQKDLKKVDISLMHASLIIDAIYGTGFKGSAANVPGEIIKMISKASCPTISIDLPSGLDADTGKVDGPCVKADYTLTFGLPKMGLFLDPGAEYCGQVEVVDISLPKKLLTSNVLKNNLITENWCLEALPKRKTEGHKGDYGSVYIVGGSIGMTGAVVLACQGALKTGAGLVTAGVPKSLNFIFEYKLTEAMTVPLPESEKTTLGQEAAEAILEFVEKASVLAIGPGMSDYHSGIHFLKTLLPHVEVPLVIDADGLNLLSEILKEDEYFLFKLKAPVILTPHPGEMARLIQQPTRYIQENRIEVASKYAINWNAVVVLKGAKTIAACPDGSIYVNTTGNPGMATGGSGDVLTGMISALAAQGMTEEFAAATGVYLHGLAGDMAANCRGEYGMTAEDIVKYLPDAVYHIEKKKKLLQL